MFGKSIYLNATNLGGRIVNDFNFLLARLYFLNFLQCFHFQKVVLKNVRRDICEVIYIVSFNFTSTSSVLPCPS